MLKVVSFLIFLFSVKISLLCFLRKLRKSFLPPIHVLAFFENVDPITHACTNSVEGQWKHVKRKLSAVNGSSAELLSGYLDEYLWRERYGKNGPTAFENIISHIAEIYSEDWWVSKWRVGVTL